MKPQDFAVTQDFFLKKNIFCFRLLQKLEYAAGGFGVLLLMMAGAFQAG